MYSGKPVIHAFSGGYDPVETYSAGVTVPAEQPEALASAILGLYRGCPQQRAEMGRNGKYAALEHFNYAKLAKRLERVLLTL